MCQVGTGGLKKKRSFLTSWWGNCVCVEPTLLILFSRASIAANMNIFVGNTRSFFLLGWLLSFLQTALTAQPCKSWCASSAKEWQTKCNWVELCSGCDECSSGMMAVPYAYEKKLRYPLRHIVFVLSFYSHIHLHSTWFEHRGALTSVSPSIYAPL